jgi:Tfp pilus assembly protein PilN
MTRGRAWIGVLGVLLVGIVALNVVTLSFAASTGGIDQNIQALDKENALLRNRDAQKSGIERIRGAAAAQGLVMPSADQVHYIDASRDDVATAAQRLAGAG